MAFLIMFVSLIIGVYSQISERFCVSLSLTLGNFSAFNGQFIYRGGQNHGKRYYEIDNTGQTGCANPGYLYWNANPANNWFIGAGFLLYNYICTDITNETDPSTCTNWDDSNGPAGVILTAGNCPYDAMCASITLSPNAANCSGTFYYITPNQFGDGNGRYLIYQEKLEKWVCWKNLGNVVGCPLLGVPNAWVQTNPSGMKRPFQDGDIQTYDGISGGVDAIPSSVQFTCNGHITLDPSAAPSEVPTGPSSPPTKSPSNNPSSDPSKAPSNNPTSNPTKAPSKDPSMVPSPAPSNPTTNPTQIPTGIPSMPTLNPSINPTDNPTTMDPTIAPTDPTVYPSSNPSKAPSDPTLIPTNQPTEPTDSPTNAPTQPSIEPTGNPTTIETVGDVIEDPVKTFNYYWENYRFYMVGGAILLIICLVICCYFSCKPSVKRRERYARAMAWHSRPGAAVAMQSVSYGRSPTGSPHR